MCKCSGWWGGSFIAWILLLVSIKTYAQDDHYWAQQYGAISTLMGGAMTGGAGDNSAVFYNPAALAFIKNLSLSIDASVYRISDIIIKNGGGTGINLSSGQISNYPQIIAGMVNLGKSDKLKLAYTLLTRNYNNILMSEHFSDNASGNNPDNPYPESENFIGVYDYVNLLNEQWLGIGFGYNLTKQFSFGATLFGSYRGQSYQLTNYVRETKYTDQGYVFSTTTNNGSAKYHAASLLAKFGFAWFNGPWKLGVTLTTPSVGLYGKGDTKRENSHIVVSKNPEDLTDNYLIMELQSGVKANYKHPLSIAWGVDYHLPKTRIALFAEYFFGIDVYHLMKTSATPFVYPPSLLDTASVNEQLSTYLNIDKAAKPVFNAGIGISQTVYKNISVLLGANTDYSCYKPVKETNELLFGLGNWHLYHVSGGLSYRKQKHLLSLGLSYAIAPSKQVPPNAIINNESGQPTEATISSRTYSFVLGYTYYFAKFSE
jgi:hypothetical protein